MNPFLWNILFALAWVAMALLMSLGAVWQHRRHRPLRVASPA